MDYNIKYTDYALANLDALDKQTVAILLKAIEKKLTTAPHQYARPLRSPLVQGWKLRVGDYRVLFRIEKNIVYISVIGHRSIVYKHAKKYL